MKNEWENGKCHKIYSNIINSLQDTASEDTWLKAGQGNDCTALNGTRLKNIDHHNA